MEESDAMTTLILQNVPVADLPAAWRERLRVAPAARVTVRIEEERSQATANPLFGMWLDHPDMQDVQARMDKLRAPRMDERPGVDGP